MAPPKRPSNMRKVRSSTKVVVWVCHGVNIAQETLTNKFPNGYTHAPPPAAHHTQSIFKATVTAQHQLQHAAKGPPMHPSDMAKLANGRIPFAENANPPATAAHYASESAAGTSRPNTFKTPGRPAQAPKGAKSSPAYPNGENIALPEIATDSEDEDDSEDETGGFRVPSWVNSPALRELLTQQQLVDPESVFGPIAPLQMEEVFRGKEGRKRFRDRGSSARWVETGDAVTQEEKRRDRELRARVAREGGWSFDQGA